MTIAIEEETKVDFDFDYKKVIEAVVNQAMDYKNCPYEAEVSVTLTDNDSIHAINKEFRNIDNPTDVLSFPLVEYEEAGQFDFLEDRDDCFNPESGELMLGDIVISVEKVYEQAAPHRAPCHRQHSSPYRSCHLRLFCRPSYRCSFSPQPCGSPPQYPLYFRKQ